MPTPEETGHAKPRKGRCERCGGPRGVRRPLMGVHFILCADCGRAMGLPLRPARPKRHRHGGGHNGVRG